MSLPTITGGGGKIGVEEDEDEELELLELGVEEELGLLELLGVEEVDELLLLVEVEPWLEVVPSSLVVDEVNVLSVLELMLSLSLVLGLLQPEITKLERSAKNNNCFFIMTNLLFI